MSQGRTTGWALGTVTAAMMAAGAAVGVLLERAMIERAFGVGADIDADEELGGIHGDPVTVMADDGVALYAEVDEPGDPAVADPTIVFSHGYALSMDEWHFQRRDLAGLGRLVFWDQRSHGRSGRALMASHTVDQLGRDLAAVIEALAPTGPIVLVGHSMGGMTMMALADQHPEWFGDRIVGAALLATSSGRMRDVPFGLPAPVAARMVNRVDGFAAALHARAEMLDKRRARASDLSLLLMKVYSFGGRTSAAHTEFVMDMVDSTRLDVMAEYLPEFNRHDKATALPVFQNVETLVMVGDSDLLTPPEHSVEIVRQVPGAEFVLVPATGHMIASERYPEVNRQLSELVARVRLSLQSPP